VLEQLLAHSLRVGGRRSSRIRLRKVSDHSRCVVAELPPGNAGDSPSLDEQQTVALPILLEGELSSMRFPSVELDDQPLRGPETVDFEEPAPNGDVR